MKENNKSKNVTHIFHYTRRLIVLIASLLVQSADAV